MSAFTKMKFLTKHSFHLLRQIPICRTDSTDYKILDFRLKLCHAINTPIYIALVELENGGYYISNEEYRTAHIRKQNPCFVYDGRAPRNRSPLCLLPFLDFLWKVRHAVFRLIIFMQEQSYKNEGGIYSNLWKVHTRKSHTAQRYVTPRPTVNEI